MQNVRFSAYALAQLAERELSQQAVLTALDDPDQIVTGKHGRKIAHKLFATAGKDYLLRVIYEEGGEGPIVVTVYATAKVAKYWRRE